MTYHPTIVDLAAFVRGEALDEPRVRALEQHLSTCAECQSRATEIAPDAFMTQLVQATRDKDTARGTAPRLTEGFEVLEEIGRGGAGVVYRARQTGLGREVALKRLLAGTAASPRELARFRREADALARLQHPHIVDVYDVGEQDGQPYIAMELVPGKTLAGHLAAGPLEVRGAAQLALDLAAAVACAHQQGVVHRDLKPHNVLLQKPPASSKDLATRLPADRRKRAKLHPKIADFGLSRGLLQETQHTQTGDALGTPSYMAPEQVAGDARQIGPRTDIYGLGAILYECLTGRPPFRGASAVETMQLVKDVDPIPIRQQRRGVPVALQIICHRCLEKEPRHRYATVAELEDDLQRFLDGRPILSRSRGWAHRATLWVRRNPWPAAVLVLALFAGAGGVGALVVHQRQLAAERDLAHGNYAQARAAIWKMLNTAQLESAMEVPRLGQMSLAQTEEALALFERLSAQEQSEEAQLDLARVRMLAGTMYVALDQPENGAQLLTQASEVLQQRLRQSPESQSLLHELITSQVKLAVAWTNQQRLDEAVRILEPTLLLAGSLHEQSPEDVSVLNTVSWVHHTLGCAFWTAGDNAQAAAELSQAVSFRQEALKLDPENQRLATLLSESQLSLAQAHCQLGQLAISQQGTKEAIQTLTDILQHDPHNAGVRVSLGTADLTLSNLLAAEGDLPGAAAACSHGIELVEAVFDAEPQSASARDILFRLYGNRALYGEDLERRVADWRRAVDVVPVGDLRHYCRTMLIRNQVITEQLMEAIAEARALSGEELSEQNQFRLAAAWGAIANAVSDQEKEGDAPLRNASAEALTEAVALVRRLQASGHFTRDETARAHYDSSAEFARVRAHLQLAEGS